MTRMEAIRKQYVESATPVQQPTGGGRARPTQPRHRFWLWFWLFVLAAITLGFLYGRGWVMEQIRARTDSGAEPSAKPVVQGAFQGATQNTHQGAKQAVSADDPAVSDYFKPSEAELSQLFEYVRNSSAVKENLQYAKIMERVRFFYQPDDDTMNAFAALRKLDKDKDTLTRVVVFFGGAARFSKVASLAVASHLSGDKLAPARLVKALAPADCGKLGLSRVVSLVNEAGLGSALADEATRAKAKSVSAGMILGILAHEAGHQALGHTFNVSEKVNLDISRNQEREADSFASSVIADSPFGEYILAGTLFWHFALASQQGDAIATTHPLSKERFENFVRANPELAQSMGISLDGGKRQ